MRSILNTVVAEPYGLPVTFVRSRVGWQGVTGEKAPTGCLGATQALPDRILVGWFDERLATLVHEVVHAAVLILVHVGIDPTDSQGEALAYLTDWLFQQGRQACRITAG